jgi:hypothetical protein
LGVAEGEVDIPLFLNAIDAISAAEGVVTCTAAEGVISG